MTGKQIKRLIFNSTKCIPLKLSSITVLYVLLTR